MHRYRRKPVKVDMGWPINFIRQRELGSRYPLGNGNHLSKVLYTSLEPSYSFDETQSIRGVHHGGVFNLEFSPDGSLLVAACEKRSFLMFDPLTQKQIHAVENAHRDCVNCVRFLDSRTFVTCSDDSTVALWDARNVKTRIRTLKGHSNWVKNIEYSQKDGLLVTSGFDGSIYSWDINSYTEDGFMYERVFHTNGLMRTRLTPDASKMVICTTGGYLMIIHDLNLHTLFQDLQGFKPNMYRLMQQSQTTIPSASAFTNLFSKKRKRNRIEFISDFPTHNDAEVVSSLQIHPQGWCALSRNISHEETSEWTCIHDIQDHSDEGALTDNDEVPSSLRDDDPDVPSFGRNRQYRLAGAINNRTSNDTGDSDSDQERRDSSPVLRRAEERFLAELNEDDGHSDELNFDSSSIESSDDELEPPTSSNHERSSQAQASPQRQGPGRFHALLETVRSRSTTSRLLNEYSSLFQDTATRRQTRSNLQNASSSASSVRTVRVRPQGNEILYSEGERDDGDEPPLNVRVFEAEDASSTAATVGSSPSSVGSGSSAGSLSRSNVIISGARRRSSRPGTTNLRGGRFLRSASQVNSAAAAAMAAAAASSAAAAAMQAAQASQAAPRSRSVAAAQAAALAGREAATAALDVVSDRGSETDGTYADRADRAAEAANRAAAAASRSARIPIPDSVFGTGSSSQNQSQSDSTSRAPAVNGGSATRPRVLATRVSSAGRPSSLPGSSTNSHTSSSSTRSRNPNVDAANVVTANAAAAAGAARQVRVEAQGNSPFAQNMELHVASADVWEALVVIREARARRQHARAQISRPQDRREVISRFVRRLQELQPRDRAQARDRTRARIAQAGASNEPLVQTFRNAAGTVTTTSMIGNNSITTGGSSLSSDRGTNAVSEIERSASSGEQSSSSLSTNASMEVHTEELQGNEASNTNGDASVGGEEVLSTSTYRPMRLARRNASRNAARSSSRGATRSASAANAVGNLLSIPTSATRTLVMIAPNDGGAQNIHLRVSPNSFTYQSHQIRLPRNHKIHQNSPRLLHYIEEPNVGKGFIKELCFSSDGRVMCSPFGHGVRLLAFSPDCQEISTCHPPNPPVELWEVSSRMSHSDYVVSSKFSPTHCLLVSGCLKGKIVWHQPVL